VPGSSNAPLSPRSDLPLLNWEADTAAKVVRSLADEFDRAKMVELLHGDIRETMLRLGDGAPVVIDLPGHPAMKFDALVLAVGFGQEEGESYWNNDGLQSKTGVWLVSGLGDG